MMSLIVEECFSLIDSFHKYLDFDSFPWRSEKFHLFLIFRFCIILPTNVCHVSLKEEQSKEVISVDTNHRVQVVVDT